MRIEDALKDLSRPAVTNVEWNPLGFELLELFKVTC